MSDFSPLLFSLIGPGASGKSSICEAILKSQLPVIHAVSSTTRLPRPYEKEGREYYFLDMIEFNKQVTEGFFLEFAEFAGNFYGTGKRNLEIAQQTQKHLLLDIEINGVKELRKQFGSNLINIFICPPSLEALRDRFKKRGSDSLERIEERMEIAKLEIKQALEVQFSDYVIINDDFETSVSQVQSIIVAEQLKAHRFSKNILS